MKKLLLLFACTATLLFTSCEGEQGPPGVDGINILGKVFEITTNFQYNTSTGLQESLITIPTSIEVFESDVILVYRLEKVVDINGVATDAWSPLPQNFFLNNQEIIQYVFNHTFVDLELLIDGNFNLDTLGNEWTNDQIFRIAIIPSEFATANLSMEALLQKFNIESIQIEPIPN